jgi:hypothetical protein
MLFRREDMVWLQFSFYNLVLQPQKGSGVPQLIRETAGDDAYVVVGFPVQHVSEQCVDAEATTLPNPGQILTKTSGPSQIAFMVPSSVTSIPCTDEGLLDWQGWSMELVGLSTGTPPDPTASAPLPLPPGPMQTDLQVVDHLHLTPDSNNAIWENVLDPVTNAGWTELWGTRLVPTAESNDPTALIRAVAYEVDATGNFGNADTTYAGSPAPSPNPGIPGIAGLEEVFRPYDPHDIYVATNFAPSDVPGTAPASADLLMLTSLGAWLEIEGAWGQALGQVPIAEWKHRSTQGRDNYVKVVDRGALFPFGHLAELVTISERAVKNGVAYIQQRSFVRVKEPTKVYPVKDLLANGTVAAPFPFTQVTLKTLVTPDILVPTIAPVPDPSGGNFYTPPAVATPQPDLLPPGATGQAPFWIEIDTGSPTTAGPDVPFHLVATDAAGNTVDFTASLAFMYLDYEAGGTGAYVPDNISSAVDYYNGGSSGMAPTDPRRLINIGGQKVAFAPERTSGDSTHPTSQISLGASTITDAEASALGLDVSTTKTNSFYLAGIAAFAPVMTAAQVRVPAVESLQGGAPAVPTPPSGSTANNQQPLISYAYSYLLHGTGPADPTSLTTTQGLTNNPGGMFAMVTDPGSGKFAGDFGQALDGAAQAASDSQAYVTNYEQNIGAAITQAGGASYLDGLPAKEAIDKLQAVPAYATATATAANIETTAANLSGKLAGGVAVPNLTIGALAQSLGPISGTGFSDLTNAAQGFVNPDRLFDLSGAKILGSIPLLNILPTNIPFLNSLTPAGDPPTAPQIQTTIVYPGGDMTQPPTGTMTVLDWTPVPTSWGPLFFPFTDPDGTMPQDIASWSGPGPLNGSDANATFALHVVIETFLNNSPPTYDINGTLANFVMDLLEPESDYYSAYPTSAGGGSPPDGPSFIVITFNRFQFTAKSGQKPNFSVDIADVTFDGPLKFIDTLEQFLSSLGDGLAIDVEPTSISASLSIPIPAVTAGIIALQNLSFGASLFLPFTGDPFRFGANFCTRENPFLVTIMCLGGGGFVGVQLGPDGLQVVEASLEVAASAAIDIGIASGSVSIAIGIYFKLEQNAGGTDEVTLTGYFQANGSVCVLGLVTISLEIYLGLTYMGPPPIVQGEATITLTVEIGPFSKSFSASVQRQFAGGDPPALTFGQQMTQSDWNTYCNAFAS